ncbi:MAG: hypothetical protein ACYTF9_00300 [Planctomycetota bacterium]|jgi:hypothetical protein
MSSGATVTLRALEGEPLAHERIREMVEATARAIAERQGVTILRIDTTPDSLSVTVDGDRLIAIGLIAELRRLSTSWYTHKFGVDTLWGDAPEHDETDEPWT